jgi:2-dehydro-3-deoxygluconokinase
VHDRVGGGDGFASGFFYGLLTGESAEESVKLGWAHGALLTTFPGDTTMATPEQVRSFAKGGSAASSGDLVSSRFRGEMAVSTQPV